MQPRIFITWNDQVSLKGLRDKLSEGCAGQRVSLKVLQDARDIIEHLLQDQVVYHNDIYAYLPQQTQNNPVQVSDSQRKAYHVYDGHSANGQILYLTDAEVYAYRNRGCYVRPA